MNRITLFITLLLPALLTGCASNLAGKPRALQNVRTTAYTHTERDHILYGKMSADGSVLSYGRIRSAAADWSRFPVGTKFRIRQTGQTYQIDDYGSALTGTSTIDLYTPNKREMRRWGVRFVDIDVLEWGSPAVSLKILEPRKKHAHVRRMFNELQKEM